MTNADANRHLTTSSPHAESLDTSGLIGFFARNHVAVNLLMVLLLVGGYLSARSLMTEVFPTIDSRLIQVSVAFPGASPSEVEEGITRRVEEVVMGIEGVAKVFSTASENLGRVMIELKDFADSRDVLDDVKTAVDQLIDFPPEDAEEAQINIATNESNVLMLIVTGDRSAIELRQFAEVVEDHVFNIPSVSLVSIEGTKDHEISINVSENALREFGLTIEEISRSIIQSSMNLSSGEIRTDGGDVILRTQQKRLTGSEFENIVVRALPDGTAIRLASVASVVDGLEDTDLYSTHNGKPAVFVRVTKSEAEDVIRIANDVKGELTSIRAKLPEDIDVLVWNDESVALRDRLDLLFRNGALGFALVVAFLLLMLDMRLAFWVAMGIPISFLGGFMLFGMFDVTINMVSLFALIVVLGIVVDDAIVVGENVALARERGLNPLKASIEGVRGVISPVMIGVLSTMVAFLPLVFLSGTFGQLLGVVPIVVIAVLVISLIEVFLILPSHLAHRGSWSLWPLSAAQDKVREFMRWFRDELVIPAVSIAMRHRVFTLSLVVVYFIGSVLLVVNNHVRLDFLPQIEGSTVSATVKYPLGTPFDVTHAGSDQLVRAALRVNASEDQTAISSITTTVGGILNVEGGPEGSTGIQQGLHLSSVTLDLNPEPIRQTSSSQVEQLWWEEIGDLPGIDEISIESSLIGGQTIDYELTHPDEGALEEAVEFMSSEIARLKGFTSVSTTLNTGKRQIDIELKPAGDAAGLTPAAVARQLRNSFFGEEVHRIQRGRYEVKVMVRYPDHERRSIKDLYDARIRLSDGTEVPLSVVARLSEGSSFARIDRSDGRRVVTVSADMNPTFLTSFQATALIDSEIVPQVSELYPDLQVFVAGTASDQSEDLENIGSLFFIAIIAIYTLLAAQLRSYVLPIIILVGVPLGAAGAIIGHYLLGFDMSMPSFFGIVALSGVVVNDSLVLIDLYNKLRAQGQSELDAIVEATRGRFRPIFLTTVTTFLGLTPMLFEPSVQAAVLIPMAISLAIGILFASVMILFVVPTLLRLRSDIASRISRRVEQPMIEENAERTATIG